MTYRVDMLPRAMRDLNSLSPEIARRILGKIDAMRNDLAGDVKRLTGFNPGMRLRVGDYRVLFDVEGDRILIQAIRHRSEAYDR